MAHQAGAAGFGRCQVLGLGLVDAGRGPVCCGGAQLDSAVQVLALEDELQLGAALVRCGSDDPQVGSGLDAGVQARHELAAVALDAAADRTHPRG